MKGPVQPLPVARLVTWAAWAPDRIDREDWRQWARGGQRQGGPGQSSAAVPGGAIPALLRRRCSALTRMMVEVALATCAQAEVSAREVTMVYGSRHGEVGVLGQLLEDLSQGQPLSPTLFSNSVHHSATGYFDLVTGHRLPSRTLSGGEANLVCGYLEALGLLGQWPALPCLLVFADERLPEPFRKELDQPPVPYAVGFLLTAEGVGRGRALRFRRELEGAELGGGWRAAEEMAGVGRGGLGSEGRAGTAQEAPTAGGEDGRLVRDDAVLDFLRWLECDDPSFSMQTRFGTWTWNK